MQQVSPLFLVDVNLPKHFSFFNNPSFIHVSEINPMMTDQEIWTYALANKLVIITKDTDFYYKCITSSNYPKIIHLQLGKLTLKELHNYFEDYWEKIVDLLKNSTLIVAKKDRIITIL